MTRRKHTPAYPAELRERGVYHYMSAKHLHRYVDEYAFRHNTAQMGTMRFINMTIERMTDKRLTYERLIWSWSSPGLMDTFHLMKESVFHAANEEPVPDGIQGTDGCAGAIRAQC